ncbi:hypothetical protein SAMN05216349_11180 [Oribacterium sp. KHPX15]|nr:hypothetical protein SAMN05216349_11180 [Oribacterium sp. KHPX15]
MVGQTPLKNYVRGSDPKGSSAKEYKGGKYEVSVL